MADLLDLTGRRAFLTGSCRGIGAAIAVAFAEHGATVAVHDRDDNETSRTWAAAHGFEFFAADLSDADQVRALADGVLADGKGLDILVNNAGVEFLATMGNLDPAAVSTQLMVNLEAPILLTNLLVGSLKRSPYGSIITITSIHADVPSYGNSVYCAAKAGLELFTRTIAIELGPYGVRANAIAPGAIETDINRFILDEIGRDNFAQWIPLGRVGQVDDIAHPALFLASDASRYVTGATLVVDGAYSQHLVRYRMADVH